VKCSTVEEVTLLYFFLQSFELIADNTQAGACIALKIQWIVPKQITAIFAATAIPNGMEGSHDRGFVL